MSLTIDDNIKISSGKYKNCSGILREINSKFCKVEVLYNSKKDIHFNIGQLLVKVKKDFISPLEESISVEMPTLDDCVVVDKFPGEEHLDIMATIEAELEKNKSKVIKNDTDESPFLPQSQDPPLKVNECITEHHVVEQAITMVEAEDLKSMNEKLREEIATYKYMNIPLLVEDLSHLRADYKKLYEEWTAKDDEITRLNKLLV